MRAKRGATMPMRWIINILMVAAFLALAACAGASPAAAPTEAPAPTATPSPAAPLTTATPIPTPTGFVAPATVSIWHAWDESHIPTLVQIQRDFRALNPDVHFDVLYVPVDDLLPRFEAEARKGGGPAIVLGSGEWGPQLAQAGLLADLGALGLQPLADTLNAPAVQAARYQGALIGLPYAMQGVVLYRNKAIIPTRAEDFDELVSVAQQATQGEQIGAILERSFYYAGAHLEGIGGALMDARGLPAFNDAKGLEWLELLRQFEAAGPPNYFSSVAIDTFKEGRVGWIIGGTWELEELVEAVGVQNLAIDAWPGYGDGALSGYVQAENVYLNANAQGQHLQASLDFIEYFLSAEAQTQLIDIGLLPASSGVQVVDITTGHLTNQALAALSGGAAYPVVPGMETYNTQMEIALKSFYDGAPAEQVLAAAEGAILEQLGLLQATPTPTP